MEIWAWSSAYGIGFDAQRTSLAFDMDQTSSLSLDCLCWKIAGRRAEAYFWMSRISS